MKRMLSNKLVSIETIISIENKNIADNKEIRKVFSGFFSNILKILNIPRTNIVTKIFKMSVISF